MKLIKNFALPLVLVALLAFSCKKDDDIVVQPETFTNGILIVNEGAFGSGNGSVDFKKDTSATVQSGIFNAKNNRPLGDVVQSIELIDGKAFIVVNNSGKIEVVNPDDFASLGTISGLTSPRYIKSVGNGRAYVTDLFAGNISVVDLSNLTVTGTIATGGWSEAIQVINSKAYVTIADSDYVAVVDVNSNTVTSSIQVSKGPNSMVVDAFGKLWVLCDGGFNVEIPQLHRINPTTGTVEASFSFGSVNDYPNSLQISGSGQVLTFLNNDIFQMGIAETAIPTSPVYAAGMRYFYGVSVHPTSGNVYASDAKDFTKRGTVLQINPANGTVIDTALVGIAPSRIYFR